MIFKEYAPAFWAKGMPVVPLHGKAPVVPGWQRYNDTMPSAEDMKNYLDRYGDCNMGLPLGKQSRCIALDIDSEIEAEIQLIDSIVPQSPWIRVGKKGKVMMYRFNGEQTFRIKDESGRTICELLSSKTQVVLPPSIHPDTHQPYVANCPLADVVDQLPVLPKNIEEILRNAFVDKLKIRLGHSGWSKTIDFVSRGSRDVKMTSVAGVYAQAVLRGEMTLREAIEVFRAWCSTQTEQVVGDPIDVEKGVKNLVKFLLRNVMGDKKRPLPTGWDNGLTKEEKVQLGAVVDEDSNVSWDFAKVRDYIKENWEKCQDSQSEIDRIIDFLLQKIATSQNMNSLDTDRALKNISNLSKDVKVPALRKRLLELKSDGITGTNHTEIARAVLKDINDIIPDDEAFTTQREFNSLRYYNNEFWQWGGSHWEKLDESEILRRISIDYGHFPAASKANDHKGILSVMKNQLDRQLSDVDYNGVNYANGFVDAYGELHEHSKKYGCTYTLPYCYRPELASLDKAPKFSAFLESVWGTDYDYAEKVKALQQVIATTIFGYGPSFARAILLYGIGQSGKTQLLTIISHLLPNEALSYVNPYDFADKFKPAELSNSLLNVCGELDEKRDIPAANFKQVIDGTIMQGQYKGKQIFTFKPKATHWFASNHLPHSKDTTEGFNRRWAIFTFNHMVPKEKKIRGLGDIIVAEEREAISAWAIAGMRDLHKKSDFDLPPSHYVMVNEMCSENDSLFFFLTGENGPRQVEGSKVEVERVFEAYRAFCYSVAGARPIGLRKFFTRMKEMGILLHFKVGAVYVEGLSLDRTDGTSLKRDWR